MHFDIEMIEARLAMKMIPSSDMPRIAWDALEAGLDGPAIRRLAALDSPTWSEIDEVLPSAMHEMGLRSITAREGASRYAVRRATEILRSGADPLKFTREFEQLWIATGHENEIVELGILDEEIVRVGRLIGRSEQEIRDSVSQQLKSFVARHAK